MEPVAALRVPAFAAPTLPTAPPATPPEAARDTVDLSGFSVQPRLVPHLSSPEEAMALQAPALERPVLMIHGLAQHADTWINFKNFFTGNPANPDGGVYHVDRDAEFRARLRQAPGARVFSVDLSDNLRSPQVLGAEVRRAVTAILEGTGATEVDLVTHSMGGLVAREALRQGEDRVRNLVMIAPPTHGAMEATMASLLDDGHVYSHYPAEKMEAMNSLRLEYGPRGGVRNRWLHELNEDWKNHAGRVRGSVLAGVGLPTPDASLTGTNPGDGMVAAVNAPLEGAGFYLAQPQRLEPGHPHFRDFQNFRYNHLQIVSEPEIYKQVSELLTSAPTAPPAAPPRPAPTPAELAESLRRTAEARKALAGSENARQIAEQWRTHGIQTTVTGGALVTAGVVASATGSPTVGVVLSVTGLALTALGALQIRRNEEAARDAADAAARTAYEALNLADDTVHRVQRDRPASAPS